MKKCIGFKYVFQWITKIKQTLFIICCFFIFQSNFAQNIEMEVGVGIGNVVGEVHEKGKGELFLSVFKSYKFGELGLDLSTGGNFIPGNLSTMEENIEIVSPNDSKFWSISALYRCKIKKHFFIEPRLGFASLYSFVHTDNTRRINQSNFTAGFGIGARIERFVVSLRYQYYGETADFEGVRNTETIISNSEPFDAILLRVSFRFGLGNLFKKKESE
ncbi:hypothetical protein [Dokdonia pacifica]|uniref:Outer membrane protein beta-barrel domain-containing protein n=1 Tax=Dokdonia pacifica TaxID=1627892 RepID=A0A238WG84_9FLAO|nr:hypothetical protein [Dokdonia pacifica]SNR45447.1 hypothetical protein SAMN06265376_1011039 [Dokdonia pacifica]